MDEMHTINEKILKMEALFEAINKVHEIRKYPISVLQYQIETLKVLSDEARDSFEGIKDELSG